MIRQMFVDGDKNEKSYSLQQGWQLTGKPTAWAVEVGGHHRLLSKFQSNLSYKLRYCLEEEEEKRE